MTNAKLTDRDVRQRDLVPPTALASHRTVVVGVGAVGRQVALQLAATGAPDIVLIDHDQVEIVNLAPQGYAPADLYRSKVDATRDACLLLNPAARITPLPRRFKRSEAADLTNTNRSLALFCCVDSIATRKLIWEAVHPLAAFFVDGRMSAETLRVLASGDPRQEAHYQTTLFEESEAHQGACTAKSTIYSASVVAGLMVGQFAKHLRRLPVDADVLFNLLSMELAVDPLPAEGR